MIAIAARWALWVKSVIKALSITVQFHRTEVLP
jgi:hypothetical protein